MTVGSPTDIVMLATFSPASSYVRQSWASAEESVAQSGSPTMFTCVKTERREKRLTFLGQVLDFQFGFAEAML